MKRFILFFILSAINLSAQNFFPVKAGDTLHYHTYLRDNNLVTRNNAFSKSIVEPFVFDGHTYFNVQNRMLSYDPQEQKIYHYYEGSRMLGVDFLAPVGSLYTGRLEGINPVLWMCNGITSGVFCARWDTVISSTVISSTAIYFTEGKGFTQIWTNSSVSDIIEAKGADYSFTFAAPQFSVSPPPATRSLEEFPFSIQFNLSHLYPELVDTLCAFIEVYRNGKLIISRVSKPTTYNSFFFPINILSSELAEGDVVKLNFLMTDSALFKNRKSFPEQGSFYINVTAPVPIQRNWVLQNPYPNSSSLSSVKFISDKIGFAAGYQGTVIRTTDGGDTWSDISTNFNYLINDVFFLDENYGFAVGQGGIIYKTTNGGKIWSRKDSGQLTDIQKIYFLSRSHGFYIIKDTFSCYETTNGGDTWSPKNLGVVRPRDIQFFDELNGVMAGNDSVYNNGMVVTTTDGGTSWKIIKNEISSIKQIYFLDKMNGFAAWGKTLKTTDGGYSWIAIDTMESKSVRFSDINHGIIIPFVGNLIRSTTDGGVTWTNYSTGISASSMDAWMIDNSNIIYLGVGTSLKSSNGGADWSFFTQGYSAAINSIEFANEKTAVAVGASGTILINPDRGNKWYYIPADTKSELFDLSFANPQEGLAVGSNCALLKTTDGGYNWFSVKPSSADIYGIYTVKFVNPSVAYAGGYYFFKTTDGGNTWTSSFIGAYIYDMSFLNEKLGYLNAGDKLLKTTDGGITFTTLFTGKQGMWSVQFIDEDNGYVSNSSGIFKTTDGGKNWTPVYNGFIYKIKVLDKNNIAAINNNEVLRSSDGGNNWMSERLSWTNSLTGLNFSDASHGYVYGMRGLIMATSDVYTSVFDVDNKTEINGFHLAQNYPNPFNPSTKIEYSVSGTANIKITLYDILGRELMILVNEQKTPGHYSILFNGNELTSGVYFYKIDAGSYTETKKMLLLK